MKRIIVVRHAKSVPYGYDDDFNRELTNRGIADAQKISKSLVERGIRPEKVFSSNAARAMHTAVIFCESFGYDSSKIRIEPSFYEGITTNELIQHLENLSDEIQTVFIFGHNPTVFYWVSNLAKIFNADMPTCSTVVIDFEVKKWKDVKAREGKVLLQLTPKTN
jgi:phosphohistidine phosphatase